MLGPLFLSFFLFHRLAVLELCARLRHARTFTNIATKIEIKHPLTNASDTRDAAIKVSATLETPSSPAPLSRLRARSNTDLGLHLCPNPRQRSLGQWHFPAVEVHPASQLNKGTASMPTGPRWFTLNIQSVKRNANVTHLENMIGPCRKRRQLTPARQNSFASFTRLRCEAPRQAPRCLLLRHGASNFSTAVGWPRETGEHCSPQLVVGRRHRTMP